MNNTYQLKMDNDGKLWVTVNELMKDIANAIDQINKLEHPRLIEVDTKELDTKKIGLHAIYTFLGALQTEYALIKKQEELLRQPTLGSDIQLKTVQFDVPIEVTKETLH